MRGKKNREVNIFSASVVDLFASGLGVFLIVSIIALVNQKKNDSITEKQKTEASSEVIVEKSNQSEEKLLLSVINQLKKENKELKALRGSEKNETQTLDNQEQVMIRRVNDTLRLKASKLEAKIIELQSLNTDLSRRLKKVEKDAREDQEKRDEFEFKLGSKIQLSNVQFYAGTAKPIQPYAMAEIRKLAQNLKKKPNVKIEVSGHIFLTEKEIKTGEDLDKSNLSGRRAQLVCNELVTLGVRRSRLRCVGYGGRRYLYLTNDQYSEKAQLNRRVEIEVLEK